MQRLRARQNVNFITFLLMLVFLAACSEPLPDETRLRQAVADMEKAAEAKQTGPILDYLAKDFLGNKIYRKANIRGMLLLQFHQNQHIHIYLHIVELKIKNAQAQIQVQVVLAGRDKKIIPEHARILVIDSDWQKRDGEWRVIKARWQDGLFHS
jgi:hypothetical protein